MALKSNLNSGRLRLETLAQAEILITKIIESFQEAGERFIADARGQVQDHGQGTYMDQTTNLRNSIGYFITRDGEIIHEANKIDTNRAKIEDLIKPRGIQLIGIAGMNYASHVESRGYNVISYQADVCMVNLAMYLETLEVIGQGSAARLEESFLP